MGCELKSWMGLPSLLSVRGQVIYHVSFAHYIPETQCDAEGGAAAL